MCGIAGIVGRYPEASGEVLDAIHHRGPDARGEERLRIDGKPVWLGHTRLSILDLSEAGAQPMRSADGRWLLTFNGEIYNHLDMRARLPGVAWRGHSDTETLVEALAAWGVERTLEALNGMFAFAAVDELRGRIWLVRDHFGIKPLYYSDGPGLAFASRVDALESLLGRRAAIDARGLQSFLALRFVPSPNTLLQGVHRLPAGHVLCMTIATGQRTLRRWIQPTRACFDGSINDAVDAYAAALRTAVRRQLLSDVPVGVFLSGGIDSALITAMAKDLGEQLPTFSVGYDDGSDECELEDAADTARVLGLPNHGVRAGPEDLWRALEAVVDEVEEPLGTTSILPMWHLVRHARADVTVALTGQGTDEPWGGYRRYQSELLRSWVPSARALRPLRHLSRLPRLPDGLRRSLLALPEQDDASRFIASYTLFSPDERKRLLGVPTVDVGQAHRNWLAWLADVRLDSAERMMRLDTHLQLADDLLLYGDKTSMAVALETRVPMLDTELVTLVESFPLSYRVRAGRTKIVHRMLAQRFLPNEIVNRPKRGFGVPFAELCRGPWRTRVQALLLEGPHLETLSRDAVAAVWREHLEHADRTRQIFALLTLSLWWRRREGALELAA